MESRIKEPLLFRQPGLEPEYLQRRAGINLYHGVIGYLLMPRQLPGTVLLYHLPNLAHPFDDEHPGVSEAVLLTVSVLPKELVVFLVYGIYGVQQPCQVVVESPG